MTLAGTDFFRYGTSDRISPAFTLNFDRQNQTVLWMAIIHRPSMNLKGR